VGHRLAHQGRLADVEPIARDNDHRVATDHPRAQWLTNSPRQVPMLVPPPQAWPCLTSLRPRAARHRADVGRDALERGRKRKDSHRCAGQRCGNLQRRLCVSAHQAAPSMSTTMRGRRLSARAPAK
jgi:hypothetical protein